MNLEFIFKVIDKDEWQKAKQSGIYGGSEKDIKDGYIHFSEEDQVEETLNKYLREYEGYNKIKKFWQDHTKVIRQFHRYPHRNEILGREPTEEEIEFLKGPNSSW